MEQLLEAQGAKRGEVQVSLHWANKNDLDLHVITPQNEEIYYRHPQSKCGGKLDLDMNRTYESATNKAVENIFWPEGKAQPGLYKVYVHHFQNFGKADWATRKGFAMAERELTPEWRTWGLDDWTRFRVVPTELHSDGHRAN